MSLRQKRNDTREAIIEGRFITHVLQGEARELDQDIEKRTSGFNSPFWKDRRFTVTGNRLSYQHARGHRFVDIRTRQSEKGIRKKRSYQVHNKPIFGHANQIVKEISFGLTDAVKEQMMDMDGTKI